MDQTKTELVFILDRSGSMQGLEKDTTGGFNSLIQTQRKTPGEALITTFLFDHACEMLHDRVQLSEVPMLTTETYYARGTTALLDAVGHAISHIDCIHRYQRPEDVPGRTLFVIATDGMENASRQYNAAMVKRMIREKQSEQHWEFLFLGANMDAVGTAEDMGIDAGHAVTYRSDSIGTRLNYAVLSDTVCAVRSCQPISPNWKYRIEQDEARK